MRCLAPVFLLLLFILVACDVPRDFQYAQPLEEAHVKRIFVVSHDGDEETRARSEKLAFARFDISIPPTHQAGEIEWPGRKDGTADPSTDFATIGTARFDNVGSFLRGLRRDATPEQGRAILFYVHGFNNTVPEATYRLAQMVEDLDIPVPAVLFSWPSAGTPGGYLYDKDSVLFSRSDLVEVLRALKGQEVVILAHSMGSQLTMEALRQLALEGDRATLRAIDSVTLMAPDIDPDLFRRQVNRIGSDLPQPLYIFSTEQDRALRISSFLTGGRGRLGSKLEPEEIKDLPVTVIDFSEFSNGRYLNHMTEVTSPQAIAILRGLASSGALSSGNFAQFVKVGDITATEASIEEIRR